jgi:STE24 endopeptidase
MNLMAGLLILACLVGSELAGATVADDLGRRVLAVLLTVAIVPALAFFQSSVLLQKIRREQISLNDSQALCRRMTASHALAWLSASSAIIWALRWQDVVRGNWNLDRWPLLDELMILLPALLSMLLSWAVFYDLHVELVGNRSGSSQLKQRLEFVSIRFRVYFLIVLIPVGIFVLLRDVSELISRLPEPFGGLVCMAGLVGLALGFPLLMLFVWKNGPIEDVELRGQLLMVCRDQRLTVFGIRTWRTGQQVVNAVVAGMLPWLRIVFLSDGLLTRFTRAEVVAVFRHEAGHLKRWHVPIRMFFWVAPLLALAWIGEGIQQAESLEAGPVSGIQTWSSHPFHVRDLLRWLALPHALFMVGLVVYYGLTTRWLSHQMEYDADLFAIGPDAGPAAEASKVNSSRAISAKAGNPVCEKNAIAMKSALLRLAAISPSELDRSTFFHPSIRQRLCFIERVIDLPTEALRFRRTFLSRCCGLAAVLVLVIVLVIC